MKLPIKVIGLVLLCIIIGILIIFQFSSPHTNSYIINVHKINTVNEINQCYLIIKQLEGDQHKSIKDILGAQTTTGNLNQDFVLLTDKNREELGLTDGWKKYIKSSGLVDAWGHPLQIKWREDLIGSQYDILKTNTDAQIVIWSIGANGIDEAGLGDDVTGN